MAEIMKTRILFVCTGNAGRSQIAQALFSRMAGADAAVLSAGVDPWPHLHPVAVRLLRERGIDTTDLHPKHVKSFANTPMDWVVTLGDRARAETPRMGGNPTRLHWDIADPADADGTGREEAVFRQTMAAIEERLSRLLEAVRRWPAPE
jgi:ArsR family transcriptional regulator, arsenate/arsenite/antimonite-responsive transcriptional repressor / arsenate reductase (thioredoxin)